MTYNPCPREKVIEAIKGGNTVAKSLTKRDYETLKKKNYEIIRLVVESLRNLIAQGDRIIRGGQNLSNVKIAIGVSGGASADFTNLVNRMKEINKNHEFGYDSELESLGNLGVGNWSELVAKANILLPIAEQFERKLEPPLRFDKYGFAVKEYR